MRFSTLGIASGLLIVAGACGDSSDPAAQGSSSNSSVSTTIGDQGGAAQVDGASLVVPEGALSEDTQVGIARLSTSDAEEFLELLSDGQTAASAIYVFTPHGSQFDEPVTITLEYTGSASALSVLRLDDEDDRSWEAVAGADFAAGEASFETTRFSLLVVTRQEALGDDAGTDLMDAGQGGQPTVSEEAGTSGPDAEPNEVSGDFAVELINDVVSIAQGQQGYFDVVATRAPGFDDPIEVSIEGLPEGVTLVEGPTTIQGQDQGTLLYLSAAATAELGESAITITASAGNTMRMLEGTLEITAPPGGFTFGVLPYLLTVARGGSAEATLTLTPENGFEGVVDLTLDFAPEGVTVSPLMVEMSGTEPTVQTLTFSAAETTEVGMTNMNLTFTSEQTESGGAIGIGITIQ